MVGREQRGCSKLPVELSTCSRQASLSGYQDGERIDRDIREPTITIAIPLAGSNKANRENLWKDVGYFQTGH
ncbi:hypothetical protein HN011_004268 [Eciton burchellii]|nr:hypothetical protein HN011_004268 [Eciton burchellii]